MIFDSKAWFKEDVDAYATGVIGDRVDLGNAGLDIGVGEPVYVGIQVGTTYAGLTSIIFNLQHCATLGGTYATLVSTKSYTLAEMKAGKVIKLPVPEGCMQFTRLSATVTGTGTAGKITAGFVK